MSIFEAIMLVCFGAAWPLSILKSYKSRSVEGKSLKFMLVIEIGYVSGLIHKFLYSFDIVFYLYVLNSILVFADICLYLRNAKLAKEAPVRQELAA